MYYQERERERGRERGRERERGWVTLFWLLSIHTV